MILDTLISQQPSIFPPPNTKKKQIYFPIFWIYTYIHTYVSKEKIFEQKLSTAWLFVKNNKSEILHNSIKDQKLLVFEKNVTVKRCKTSMTDLHARYSGTCKLQYDRLEPDAHSAITVHQELQR
jgi:hypothetical protein